MRDYYEECLIMPPKSFMNVRHICIKGTNQEIGEKLAQISKSRHGLSKDKLKSDSIITKNRFEFYSQNYPVLCERGIGVSRALSINYGDYNYDPHNIIYNMGITTPMPIGCSVVHYPQSITNDGNSYLSRNFDFPTGSIYEITGEKVTSEQV